eukprot:TRINITY_DN12385_c0_g1_i1.p1 TRINITY_DN12385_c0_g1~~TRINITY_DN12385_c0_g1_i1.p1  ORF type:complete len:100 (-),score=27.11 TRINITY_DN12385_c0_g1_i1:43-342(-)
MKSCSANHGDYSPNPPGVIAAQSNGTWHIEAGGMGVEGECTYYIGEFNSADSIYFYFRVPEAGVNKFDVQTTVQDGYSATYTGGDGYHCVITYTLVKVV